MKPEKDQSTKIDWDPERDGQGRTWQEYEGAEKYGAVGCLLFCGWIVAVVLFQVVRFIFNWVETL